MTMAGIERGNSMDSSEDIVSEFPPKDDSDDSYSNVRKRNHMTADFSKLDL